MNDVKLPEPNYVVWMGDDSIRYYNEETMRQFREEGIKEALRQVKRIVMDGPLYIDVAGEMPYFDESGKAMSVTLHSQICRFEESQQSGKDEG